MPAVSKAKASMAGSPRTVSGASARTRCSQNSLCGGRLVTCRSCVSLVQGAGRRAMAADNPDAPSEKAILAKISWRLLPLIGLGYLIAFMDRANISFAALQMNRDLYFSAVVYGLGGGLFFLSYALFEVPSNLLLVRFGA